MKIWSVLKQKSLYFLPLAGLSVLAGCLPPMGPSNLRRDHIAYDRSIAKGLQEELLLNILQLRFGAPPIFLQTQEIIASYAYEKGAKGYIAGSPWGGAEVSKQNGLGIAGSINFSDNPTITFQPMNGKQLSTLVLAPLSPNLIFSLLQTRTPIDALFSLTLDSMGGYDNIHHTMRSERKNAAASKNFSRLLWLLRQLQLNDAIEISVIPNDTPKLKTNNFNRAFVNFLEPENSNILEMQQEVKKLTHLNPKDKSFEIVNKVHPDKKGEVGFRTLSMLSILANVSATVSIPEKEIEEGIAPPTLTDNMLEGRPVIVVHSGHHHSRDAFVEIPYRKTTYWISKKDYPSKVAFTLLQIINSLAVNPKENGAMVTIPVNH
ncbi:hypothetical protein FAI40_03150 [Acetobacteraceae bacterium]|nr:hypothetical protein FAI40_03150 [Acetobacteraceae bacterium]